MKHNVILTAILLLIIVVLIALLSVWGHRVTQEALWVTDKEKAEHSVILCQYNANGDLIKEWKSTNDLFYHQFFFWSIKTNDSVVKKLPYGTCLKRNE